MRGLLALVALAARREAFTVKGLSSFGEDGAGTSI
jgi:hypothetical protein